MLRVPQNQIQYNYTIGKEFIYEASYKEYQGHYYEFNNNFFAGKEFDINAPILIKKNSDTINVLKNNPDTFKYSELLKFNPIDSNKNKKLKSIPITRIGGTKYFAKEINTSPIRIISISETDYFENIDKNVLYLFESLEYNDEFGFLYKEDSKIPELGIFVSEFSDDDNINFYVDENSSLN